MSRSIRQNAIIPIRSGLSRKWVPRALPLVLAALMAWNQAYLPFHVLLSHAGIHSHSHGAHEAPARNVWQSDGGAGHGHHHDHSHAGAGHSHSHGDHEAPARDGEKGNGEDRPAGHHDHSPLDHLYAMGAAVHPAIVALPPVDRWYPSEVAYSAYACDGQVPSPSSRGPPAA